MLRSKTRWKVELSNEERASLLSTQLNIAPLVAKLLVNRGMDTLETAQSFLFPEETPFHDPYLLKGMDIAVNRIHRAIERKELIRIFGDYDADGVSSTTVLMETLKKLNANVDFYIPNRFSEGYGPNETAFRLAKEEGVSLLITVDTGISAIHEAEVAKNLDMDYIITDHHEPGPILPEALAIIHPKLEDSTYPFKELAGVGVALKLAHALLGEVPYDLLEIAAIGTISDLVPLFGENRLIASKGIQNMKSTTRPGLRALFKVAGIEPSSLNEESIGFGIGPRINAAGRLGDADPAVELLLTEDFETAYFIASEIDGLNKERQALVQQIAADAIKEVEENWPIDENSVIVVGKEGWNSGIIGIVASKLVDRFYRPAIVLSFDPEKGLAKGSARSIEGFDLYQNLSQCRDILPHFGGHPMAAGMTLKIEDVADLRERLNQLAKQKMTAEDFVPVTKLDTVTSIGEITLESISQMERLAPFGMGNPKPKVMINEVKISTIRKIGAESNHMKVMLEHDGFTLDGIGFGLGELVDHISPITSISVVGDVSINEWNNMRKPQIFLHDISVNNWQLFDFRGSKKISTTLEKIPKDNRILIVFNESTMEKLQLNSYQAETVVFLDKISQKNFTLSGKNIVLIDLPTNLNQLNTLFKCGTPERVYAHFHQDQQHFFSTMPTRDHFKWMYALVKKKGTFEVNRYSDDIARHKGWSRDTVDFIVKVFFELDFVTIENGFISIKEQAAKRDFHESASFKDKKEQFQLENDLLYSSYGQLYNFIESLLSESVQLEEEMEQWI
ncbi:single-stranded-DNA-specific exonuclease RecJ [Peribacillus alkalitolerans]|uniref:single-stranded-DNA-specific exonuclease RecJ n=1 Tax=Peribacillus alkalitolerans TaxID=1550385 RepID=UPI0013D16C83|nr:single-stranded-DNA-specific exonuclease RecJ [Peribacillus alkalitolerans]